MYYEYRGFIIILNIHRFVLIPVLNANDYEIIGKLKKDKLIVQRIVLNSLIRVRCVTKLNCLL